MVSCYLSEKFCRTDTVHKHNLRGSCHDIFVPRPLTEARKKSFSYRGAVVWNSLPEEAKSGQNLMQFLNPLYNLLIFNIVCILRSH